MRNFPDECQESKSDKKIVLQEKRSKIIFSNPQRIEVLKIRVDGCVIQDNESLCCDYLLIINSATEIYVELKGKDVSHAIKQIEATINILSEDIKKIKKHCFVVSTRVPKQTTSIQNIQTQFKKKYNASFRVKNLLDQIDLVSL